MKRLRHNTTINIFSLAAFTISTISGLVLYLALPDGYGYMGGRGDLIGQHFWGMARPEWLDAWQDWPQLDAVAQNHLYFIPPDLVQRHTPRALQGVSRMCEQIDRARGV